MRFDNQSKTWAGPEKSISGGFLKTFYFQRDLPPPTSPEAIGPWSNCFSRGIFTSTAKETYSHFCVFQVGPYSRTLPECQTIMIHLMTDVLLVPICILTANVISRQHSDIHIRYGSKVFANVSTCSRRQMSLLACKQLKVWIVLS